MSRLEVVDPVEPGETLAVVILYPAEMEEAGPSTDAPADRSAAPYPVVLTAREPLGYGEHLASHGFVTVAVEGQATWDRMPDVDMLNHPLQLLAALDAVEGLASDHALAGVADATRAAVVGYSFGAWSALALAGARIDPDHYTATCASRPQDWSDHWWTYVCGDDERWDEFTAHADQLDVEASQGLWRSIGDERIRAVMPMGPEGAAFLGPAGLAEADVPALVIAGSADTTNEYRPATTSLYEGYPDELVTLVTVVDADHGMIADPHVAPLVRHLMVSFLGLHLHDQPGYRSYLTQDAVENLTPSDAPQLVWGVVEN